MEDDSDDMGEGPSGGGFAPPEAEATVSIKTRSPAPVKKVKGKKKTSNTGPIQKKKKKPSGDGPQLSDFDSEEDVKPRQDNFEQAGYDWDLNSRVSALTDQNASLRSQVDSSLPSSQGDEGD